MYLLDHMCGVRPGLLTARNCASCVDLTSASASTRKLLSRVACAPKYSRQSVVTTSKRTTTNVSPSVRNKRLLSRANGHKLWLEDRFCSRSVPKRLRRSVSSQGSFEKARHILWHCRSAGLVRAAGHRCKRATTVAELPRSEKNLRQYVKT